nr:MAG TPA: hypothetical protein [Caudoviricetes sp.]
MIYRRSLVYLDFIKLFKKCQALCKEKFKK